ncbi:MAG: glutathione S-transferase family protein [Gammaproteobacteria bacterium]|nr:glutathione S-transferase family protein [Gammaproteobacteria bacterium]
MAIPDLIFYTNPQSRGRIARWMLEEVGEPYETRILEYGDEMKSPEFRTLNPMGKVPTIVHGGVVVTEAAAICAYLADVFPDAKLKPENEQLGPYYRWLFFAAGPIELLTTMVTLGFEETGEHERMLGFGKYQDLENNLTSWLDRNEYVVGDRFTAADVYLSSHLGWGKQMHTLKENATFQDYVDRTQSRPAHVRAQEIDDNLIAQS